MKLISRDIDYAVRALSYMASQKDKIITVSGLVNKLRIPHSFLRKILQVLNKKRILKSYRGQGGGFMSALRPKEIFLADLIRIFHGPLKFNDCLFVKKKCPEVNRCILKRKIDSIEQRLITELESVTLESLLPTHQSRKNAGRCGVEPRRERCHGCQAVGAPH